MLRGRVVYVNSDGTIYISQNYDVYAYRSEVGSCSLVARVPCPIGRKIIEPFRLLCRLFRHEIRGLAMLPGGNKVAAPRQGLYYGSGDDVILKPALLPRVSPELRPPTSVILDSESRVLWGEYWANSERRQVRICLSADEGRSYDIVFTFKPGEIRHIHRIQQDRYDDCYWVLAGDHGREPGIGRLSKDFKNFEWLVKGEQKYRAVAAFVLKDRIVYGTDSEKEPNGIYALDKTSGRIEKLCDTPGSSVFACKFGKWYTISTGVEYFETFENSLATLWVSDDASKWQKVFAVPKDIWSIKYFQFGSLVLPSGESDKNELAFSGQAVRKFDNKVCIAEVVEEY